MKIPAAHDAKQSRTIKIFALRVMNRLQLYRTSSLQSFSQSPQVSKAINSSTVSVGPPRLQCVATYEIEADELKTLVRIGYLRPRDVTEHVGLATASCAGTCASQCLQLEKRFRPVIPGYGKLVAYLLNVCWFEPH
jgi:hypothetical protein